MSYQRILLAAAASCILPLTAFSQAEHALAPAPELKKLDYFAGNWKTEADIKPGPMGPGGKFQSNDANEWQKGNFFLLTHVDYQSTMGDVSEFSVMGWDPAKKVYTYDSFTSLGEHHSATGTVEGDTWIWTSTDGGPFKWRYSEKMLSPKLMTVKFEASQDGTKWVTVMDGKSTKQ